jgi:hypothetical protein
MSDEPEWVFILNRRRNRPPYHRIRWVGDRTIGALCGAWIERRIMGWSHLRRDHADLFARPCRRCFPKGVGS